ncbi:MAG: hypothetical protein ACK4SA_23820, partial [Caldilinea sp.]
MKAHADSNGLIMGLRRPAVKKARKGSTSGAMLQKCRRSDPAVLSGPSIWRLRIAATLHHPTVDAARSGVSSPPNNLH